MYLSILYEIRFKKKRRKKTVAERKKAEVRIMQRDREGRREKTHRNDQAEEREKKTLKHLASTQRERSKAKLNGNSNNWFVSV